MVPKIIQTALSTSVEYQHNVTNEKQNNNNKDQNVNGRTNKQNKQDGTML